jgi:tellurite methyltransferase
MTDEELIPYKRTATFTEDTVPAGLRKDHRTKEGVYGRICVEAGRLRYTDADGERVLEAGDVALALPQQIHAVEPLGAVRFYVEFCRATS